MRMEWTEQELRQFARDARPAFEAVKLTEVDGTSAREWQDDGLMVDYRLRNGQVDCVLRRQIQAEDGRVWQMQMTAPLGGSGLPEDRMTAREREICRDDMNRDFLSGVFNRRYFETEFYAKLDEWTDAHRCASIALISMDNAEDLRASEGDAVLNQMICFAANQWKKHFDHPAERVVCRLSDNLFVVGCADRTAAELTADLTVLYDAMPKEGVASVGVMHKVSLVQSIAAACTNEVRCKNWDALYDLCAQRLRAVQACGGGVYGSTGGQ